MSTLKRSLSNLKSRSTSNTGSSGMAGTAGSAGVGGVGGTAGVGCASAEPGSATSANADQYEACISHHDSPMKRVADGAPIGSPSP